MEKIEITNKEELLEGPKGEAKKIALDLLERGLRAVLPGRAVKRSLKLEGSRLTVGGEAIDLKEVEDIYVLGGGKASYPLGKAVYELLGERIKAGLLVTKRGSGGERIGPIEVEEAGHPVPDEVGRRAGIRLLEMAKEVEEDDLAIALISGGGSALLNCPVEGVALEEMVQLTKLLLESGANINEINSVRKHLSQVKGGRLARAIAPGRTLTLIISDVVGDPLDVIASGPTAADDSTFRDALSVLEKYDLQEDTPTSIIGHLRRGLKGGGEETVKAEEMEGLRLTNHVLGNNLTALEAMAERGKQLGFEPLILSSMIEGESGVVGGVHGGLARSIVHEGKPLSKPALILSGGETTVTIEEGEYGAGGPNQEFVLGAAEKIAGLEGTAIAAIDSDGEDGGTETAGAIIDGPAAAKAGSRLGEALRKHTSRALLKGINGAIKTGPTGTNVNDLRLILSTVE